MNRRITLDFIWIPLSLGGHSSQPYDGMRLTIRWQRLIREYLQCARDVECQILGFDAETAQGVVNCSFLSNESVSEEWLVNGELVELLSGYRVLAIGKIVEHERILE